MPPLHLLQFLLGGMRSLATQLAKNIWNFHSVGCATGGVVPRSEIHRLVFLRFLRHEQIYQNDGFEQPATGAPRKSESKILRIAELATNPS